MSRKYRQAGYQDDERTSSRPAPRRRPDREGPRGRGLGAPTRKVFRCRDCGAEQPLDRRTDADAVCECGAALHSCVNCAYFDTSARFECRQPIPERLPSKTRANDCEHWSEKVTVETDGGRGDGPSDPRAAFDALFK